MNKNSTKVLIALFFSSFFALNAQQNVKHADHDHEALIEQKLNSVQHVFDQDSLAGFHEEAAWQQARLHGAPEWEQKMQVSYAKRKYINTKYGLINYAKLGGGDPVVQSPCTNMDFETGTITGWTITEGLNSNSLTQGGCCPSASTRYSLATPGADPAVPALQRVPPGAGNYTLKIGDGATTGGYVVRAKQTFAVTAANSVFIYRFAVVLEDGSHACQDQPYFNISFNDGSNNPIPCGDFNVVQIGSACSAGGDPSFVTSGIYSYKNWSTRAFDLTSYIGQNVTVEFTASDCVQTGHAGWAYVDADCKPFTLNLNGTDIPVGQTNNSFCGAATTNTLCAPPGFTYSWTGPGVTGQTGQCVNTSSIGTFSVTLGIAGTTCSFSPVLYSTFNSAPNPTVTASLTQPVCALPAGSATLNVTGGTGPYTYSWTPAVPSTSVNTNLPAGTSYTASVTDDNGCIGSTTFSVDPYPPAPAYTLDVSPGYVLSCSSPSTTITFAPTNTSTTNQWDGPAGVITGTNVVVTTPGVYTYTTINTVSTCSLTGSINITGAINLPVLTSTVTQPNCAAAAGSATVSASNGTGPYTYSWTPTVTAPTDTINSNLPPGTGYTVSVTDNVGCTGLTTFSVNSFAGAPSYTLANNPGLLLSCASPTTSLTFAPTNTNTSTSWDGPTGAITSTNVVAGSPGVYTYTAINTVSTCSITGSFSVTGTPNFPVITSTLSQPNCASPVGSATINVTGGANPYVYTWSPNVTSGSDTIKTNLPLGTNYTVSVVDNTGCTASTSFSINSFAGAPLYSLTNNPGLALSCSTPSTTLTFAPTNTNTSTSWTGPSGVISGTTTVVSAPAAGTYSYVALNTVSTCSIAGTFVVTADTIKPTAIPSPSCTGVVISLNATSPVLGVNLNWIAPTTPTTNIGNPATSTAIGVYTLVATNPSNGCVQTYTQSTSVPPITVVTSPTTNLLTCITTTVNATASSGAGNTLVWNNGTSTVTTNPLPISTSGTYTAIATNSLGCSSQSVITVSSNTVANVNINPSSTLITCATGSVNLNASSFAGGPYVYSWTPSATTFTGTNFPATAAGIYTVVALNSANGCTATASQAISMQSISASFIADTYQGMMPLPVTFTNTSVALNSNPIGTTYTWDFGDGNGLNSNDTTVNHLYNTQGTFPVVLTATNGFCRDTATRYIKVDLISLFEVPNVFTPNGDGRNDVFTFRAVNMGEITITIFDRWGLKMFESTQSGNIIWDGKNKGGHTVTDGTYFYILKATGLDGVQYDKQGTINVFQ